MCTQENSLRFFRREFDGLCRNEAELGTVPWDEGCVGGDTSGLRCFSFGWDSVGRPTRTEVAMAAASEHMETGMLDKIRKPLFCIQEPWWSLRF